MTKLATVTTLRPRDEHASSPAPEQPEKLSTEDYWERMQALRAELALLDGVG
ncbi:MAG TPA: hypothetical protein VFK52_02620 [Nocardioidaceae bacterium]|nr:hypothetical protein [Nocardioidaceae bacterium]